jgi:hypothetical protein
MSAPRRTPSLRELKANPRLNVTVLPTAARRQVEQRMNGPARAARVALRAETAERFPYRHPQLREIEPMARAVVEYGGSALALLLVETLECMPREERLAVVSKLGAMEGEEARKAETIARSTCLDIGQQLDLWREVERLRGQMDR